ncbi:MAG: pyridoxal phosphate-dependent decarboxylase family protein [Acidobacteriaceae bacterium]
MNPLDISPYQFRRLAEHVTSLAADYLRTIDARSIVPCVTGQATETIFRGSLPEKGLGEAAFDALNDVVEDSRAQNGRFFGYVLGSGEAVGATADLLASVLNQNVTAWRSAPAAVVIERTVVGWLAEAIGCPRFTGSLTGGGSSANLMGLAMAREAKLPANESGAGAHGTVYASREVHMSIPRSVALLGIGRDNLRLIATDASFQMIPEELDRAIQHDRDAGKHPIAVVASAGAVNTGAIDPILEIAEIAHRHGAWLHVDGAYGVLAAMVAPHRFRGLDFRGPDFRGPDFRGLDLADSLSLDAHKWLYQPLDAGCLLYRDPAAAQTAFAHSGDYARALTTDPVEGFAFFEESLELSRRFRALRLWLSLRYHGFEAFREAIRRDLDHAQQLAERIRAESRLELLAPVALSAVCFRYRGAGAVPEPELNHLNAAILKRVNDRGRVYLSNANLEHTFCLRACIVNHRTTAADIDSIVPEVLAAAAEN